MNRKMNRTLRIIIILLTAFAALLYMSCPTPLNPVDDQMLTLEQTPTAPAAASEAEGSEFETGVSFSIPRWAPWIGAVPQSRAFAFSDSVEITVYDSGAQVVTSDTFYPGLSAGSSITCQVVLEAGTGYTAEVEIFNNVISESVPVVTGVSGAFDITAGAATQVPVICTPVSPIAADPETAYPFTMTAMPMDSSGFPTGTGGEVWYSLVVPASGYFNIDITVPAEIGFYYAVFNQDGTTVMGFGESVGGPGPETIIGMGSPGDLYYMGIVAGAYGYSGDIEVSLSWTELTPVLLSDADVPDSELRALLEDYTGMEFSVGGSTPASQISDLDLEALTSLRTDGYDGAGTYTGITNLTGLEYCTNLDFLLLNGNDLGGADLSVLGAMTGLGALDLWNCNLQNLDFLDYITSSGFNHLKVGGNPDISLADILSVTAAKFPAMLRLAFDSYDTTGDGIGDPVTPADWAQIVSMLSSHSNLEELTLSSMGIDDAMFADLVSDVLMPRAADWDRLSFNGNSALTDITVFEDLYDQGAFSDDWSYINVSNCELDMWPGSPNRSAVDNLIAAGVDVEYENGNTLIEGIPLSDAEVPDEWLRAVLEYTVGGGKEFATAANPTPADQITSADLSALTSIYTYIEGNSEPIVISDLTGLEYCDGVYDLNFGSADLSGIDQSSGGTSAAALEGMDNLDWLVLSNSDLTSLEFIANLPQIRGLTLTGNIGLEIYDFDILTAENFPAMEYLYLSGWDIDYDGDLDADDYFTGEYWSDVMAIVRPFTNLRSLELSNFYEGDTEFARLFNTGEVLDTNAGTLTSLFVNNNELTDASLSHISSLTGLEYLSLYNNQGITDISPISGLTNLEFLTIDATSVSDLTPLQTLYDGGAFRNHFSYTGEDISIRNCGLDLTPSSTNRSIIDNLMGNGVRISYEEGNYTVVYIEKISELVSSELGVQAYGDIVAADDWAYIDVDYLGALPYSSLGSFNISDPSAPVEGDLLDMPGYLHQLAISGDYVYASVNMNDGSNQLSIVDKSSPSSMSLRGSLSMITGGSNGVVYDIAAAGNYVYFMVGDTGLRIIDVSDPDNLFIAGEYTDSDTLDDSVDYNFRNTSVWVDDSADRAYIGGGQAYDLKIIDITNKNAPVLLSTLDTEASWTSDMITDGDYAYITNNGDYGFKIIDIATETSPSVTGIYYENYWMHDVVLIDGMPFIHLHGGIRAIDVRNPASPAAVLSYSDSVSPTSGYMFYTGTYLLNNGGNASEPQGPWVLEVR